MRQKRNARRGMTLTETLVALLIVSLVSMAVAVGVTSAIQVYHRSVEFSDTQVLFSTLTQAVTDELRYARDVEVREGTNDVTSFTSMNYGAGCSFASDEKGQLTVKGRLLVGSGVYSKGALRAELGPVQRLTNNIYQVELTVTDPKGRELKKETLAVTALN